MLSSMPTTLDEETTTRLAEIGAVARHVMKCRKGDKCPVMHCWALQGEDAMKERVIQAFTSDPLGKHYAKCRKGLVGYSGRRSQMRSNCPCYDIRDRMKRFKAEYFDESPMSLQLLAACAVPKDQMMDPHPYLEELLCLKYSATRIQRRWRKFLYSRGPFYKTSLCRYYRSGRGGCRNGVNCTFAHGNHDLRHSFRPPSSLGALPVPPT